MKDFLEKINEIMKKLKFLRIKKMGLFKLVYKEIFLIKQAYIFLFRYLTNTNLSIR